jgi:hypothetical protein
MLQGKRTRRVVAATLLMVMLTNTIAPLSAYALTSGPTAPEATSFEPVDTTDMVNQQTGDFTYNIPLMEVPGPEGGYPLSLSYHAGIQPNEDASWVGLGWSLNPGAITRNVNSHPDDWSKVTQTKREYWNGVAQSTFEVGVTLGRKGSPASLSFGLSFSQDSERGFGVGWNLSSGSAYKNVGYSIGFGSDGYGNYNTAMNVSYGGYASIGFNQDGFSGASLNLPGTGLGMRINSNGSLSASFNSSSQGLSSSMSSAISNDPNGKKSGSTFFGIGQYIIPGVLQLNIGYSTSRMWYDANTNLFTYGALYSNDAFSGGVGNFIGTNESFDSYTLGGYPFQILNADPDPNRVTGAAFNDLDNYNVSAQGLNGAIRPYQFKGHVYSQSRIASPYVGTTKDIRYYNLGAYSNPNPKMNFRFINDFSNTYRQNNTNFTAGNLLTPPFDPAPVYGADGYNVTSNKLAGSRNIEYFTNAEINSGSAKSNGFINTQSLGFTRALNDVLTDKQIGGFSITNESGVTYHYALPVYSYNEILYSESINLVNGPGNSDKWSKLTRPTGYAYTWYLTGMTGADFVDRNNNGFADAGDWGYWVNFDYGKWTASYKWRNPAQGFHADLDNNFQSYSRGEKELYYLNKIYTRTHTAVFEKIRRFDGLSSYPVGSNINLNQSLITSIGSEYTLGLNRIYLLNNSDVGIVNPAASTSYNRAPENSTIPNNLYKFGGHLGNNVIDIFDNGTVLTNLESKSLKIIEFGYDYSLCGSTENSIDITPKKGKLTLTSLEIKNKGAVSLLPKTKFRYELDVTEQMSVSCPVTLTDAAKNIGTICSNSPYVRGDLLKALFNGKWYNFIVIGDAGLIKFTDKSITTLLSVGNPVLTTIYKTKNPEYNKDAYDVWGMYKADFDLEQTKTNENIGRQTTPLSALHTDAWSLRSVTTSLGSKLNFNFESDSYSEIVTNNGNGSLLLDQFSIDATNKLIDFRITNLPNKPSDWFAVGDKVDMMMVREIAYTTGLDANGEPIVPCDYTSKPRREIIRSAKYSGLPYYTVTAVDDINSKLTVNYNGRFIQTGTINNSTGICYTTTYFTPYAGNLFLQNKRSICGGGIRTKSVAIENISSNQVRSVEYNYNSIQNPALSSGVTSYYPQVFDQSAMDIAAFQSDETYKKQYRDELRQNVDGIVNISRELLPPGVMYEYVSVKNSVRNSDEGPAVRDAPGTTVYQFRVFKSSMIDLILIQDAFESPITARNLTLKNFTAQVGALKRVIQLDNNGKKLSETINQYLSDGIESLPINDFASQYDQRLASFNFQGVIKERFVQAKEYAHPNLGTLSGTPREIVMSAREEYPSIMTGQSVIDYKTGLSSSTSNLGFDFYSGELIKTLQVDGYGNRFVTEMTPAYRKYPAMGLKVNATTNKHMLAQQAASYTYRVDDSNSPLGLVSASVQTWSNTVPALDGTNNDTRITQNIVANGDVWRKQFDYTWLPDGKTADGITPYSNFIDFNWATPSSSNTAWKKTAEVSLYNVYSKVLEGRDINGNYAASKLGYNNSLPITSASLSKYSELAYSGAEDALVAGKFGGNVLPGSGTVVTTYAHTGTKSLRVAKATEGFRYTVPVNQLDATKDYFLSVWARATTAGAVPTARLFYKNASNVNVYAQAGGVASKKAGDWYLLEFVVPSTVLTGLANLTVGIRNNSTLAGTQDEFFDDFRFAPLNAGVTSYVYDDFSGELTYTLDNNNLYSRYQYDAAGRLIATYRETFGVTAGFIKLSEHEYNYQARVFKSAAYSNSYSRTNCVPPQVSGPPVTYVVPEGKYLSNISQQDADNQAIAEANTNGPLSGTCVNGLGISISSTGSIAIVFKQNGVNIIGSTYGPGNNTIYIPAAGTYEVQVIQTDNVQRQTTITGLNPIFGTFALFPSVVISAGGGTQITVQ